MKTKISAVMTKGLITVVSGTPIKDAHRLMEEKRIRHLPVTDEFHEIIGVLSNRDFKNLAQAGHSPVDWFMSAPVRSVDASVSLREAIFHLLENKISCLLVTGPEEEVAGIVTTDDLLWYLAQLLGNEKDEVATTKFISGVETVGRVADRLSAMGI